MNYLHYFFQFLANKFLTGSDGDIQRNERKDVQELQVRRREDLTETKDYRHCHDYLRKDEDLFAQATLNCASK